jgi:hypothetical protein
LLACCWCSWRLIQQRARKPPMLDLPVTVAILFECTMEEFKLSWVHMAEA